MNIYKKTQRKRRSTRIASYEYEPELNKMSKEQLFETINNIRKIMEKIL